MKNSILLNIIKEEVASILQEDYETPEYLIARSEQILQDYTPGADQEGLLKDAIYELAQAIKLLGNKEGV